MPLPEPAAGLTSRWLFPSFELFERTRSCGVLESRTASEMTDLRVLRLGRRVSPPVTAEPSTEGVMTPCSLYCGIDWATEHHDVAVVDDDGHVVARGRVGNDAAGFAPAVDAVGRGRRHRQAPDPGGDRNRARVVGGRAARNRPGDLSDQPAGRLALPGTVCGVGGQIRCHRRGAAGQHHAHRSRRAPAAARRHRTGPSHPGAGPRPTGRGVGASADRQPDPRPAQRLLPGRAGRVRRAARRRAGPTPTPAPSWPPRPPPPRPPS